MAAPSEEAEIPPKWDNPENIITNWAKEYSPRRLSSFLDGMVHTYQYNGDFLPPAVFRCDKKLTGWGLEWLNSADGKVIICPKLEYNGKSHPSTGLDVLEVQGLNDSTALLVIEEAIPKSSESIKYGLILDFVKMKLEMCETITKKGMLNSFEDSHFWSPLEMSNEWDIIDEQRIEANNPVVPATGQTTNPSAAKKRGGKRKTTAGAPGDEEQVDDATKEKKKAKANPPLTIHRAVNTLVERHVSSNDQKLPFHVNTSNLHPKMRTVPCTVVLQC